MKIEYLGHSCFRINEELVIDPYKDGSVPGLAPLRVSGSRVICSHEHADHSGRECVEIVSGSSSGLGSSGSLGFSVGGLDSSAGGSLVGGSDGGSSAND